jgi:hypothetical protein
LILCQTWHSINDEKDERTLKVNHHKVCQYAEGPQFAEKTNVLLSQSQQN